MNLVKIIVLIFAQSVITLSFVLDKESSEKFVFQFSKIPDESDFERLAKYDWIKQYQISPTTYTMRFNHSLSKNLPDSLDLLKNKFDVLIQRIEQVQHYVHHIVVNAASNYQPSLKHLEKPPNKICDKYYGMGIEDAWSRGYTGKDVVVAVVDVGINTDLKDLQPNIDDGLCFNFVHNSTDVTPEYFPFYKDISSTDHGNRCASLIAAVKGNNFCSAGIAFNATIVALKIFGVYEDRHLQIHSSSEMMARSHVYGMKDIDIYSNSWGPSAPFFKINLDQNEAIKTSAKTGRRGLGAIHVFPVSSSGNELANNEYTITVSAIDQNGTVPKDSVICASVLTSGLLKGNNLTSNSMMTTSFRNNCITSFAGVSAATAQVAGIIALALEIKPQLTLADVQDLIVYSSNVSCLKQSDMVSTNAAGLKFHPVFGFGLLNAKELVDKAEQIKEGMQFFEYSLRQMSACYSKENGYTAEFCYGCNLDSGGFILTTGCLYAVKIAKIQFRYRTSATHIRIIIVSPSSTVSVLQDLRSKHLRTTSTERKQILTSVHFWNEAANGLWVFKLISDGEVNVIGNVSLTLIGLTSDITTNLTDESTNCSSICSSRILDNHHSDIWKIVIIAAAVVSTSVLLILMIAFVSRSYFKRRNRRFHSERVDQRQTVSSTEFELEPLKHVSSE